MLLAGEAVVALDFGGGRDDGRRRPCCGESNDLSQTP